MPLAIVVLDAGGDRVPDSGRGMHRECLGRVEWG